MDERLTVQVLTSSSIQSHFNPHVCYYQCTTATSLFCDLNCYEAWLINTHYCSKDWINQILSGYHVCGRIRFKIRKILIEVNTVNPSVLDKVACQEGTKERVHILEREHSAVKVSQGWWQSPVIYFYILLFCLFVCFFKSKNYEIFFIIRSSLKSTLVCLLLILFCIALL